MRRRLPWLVALPLMAAGSLGAHLLSYLVVGARAESTGVIEGGGNELAERSSTGVASQLVVVAGIVAALLAAAAAAWLLAAVRGRRRAGTSPWLFFWLPPLAFTLQELIERLLHAEASPFQATLEPRFLLGLALQVPLGLVALFVARLLLRVAGRIVRAFARSRPIAARRRGVALRPPVSCQLPRIAALALGYPERGPPLR